jgi:lipooligosaccharide transport system ATP-binding protein
VLTTHYMDEAEDLCDRVAIMDRGIILETGDPRELVRRHIGEDVIELETDGGGGAGIRGLLARFDVAVEEAGRKVRISCTDCRPILHELADRGYRRIVRRPATLEDVFLKLTGRDLRE